MAPWLCLLALPLLSMAGRLAITHPHGQLIHGDGFYYYVYARSMLMDGDLDFANEYAYYRTVLETDRLTDGSGWDERRLTPLGRLPNPWAIGMALLLTPFFLAGRGMALLLPDASSGVLPGYGMWEQGAWLLGSAVYGAAGLALTVALLRRHVSQQTAWLATGGVLLAGSLFHYTVVATWMAHAVSFFVVTLYLWAWDRTREHRGALGWLTLGLLGGLCFLVRWQNALFNIVAATQWVMLALPLLRHRDTRALATLLGMGCLYMLGLALAMLPQLAVWNALYGSWFVLPQAGGAYEVYRYPRFLLEVLFSTNNGLITWTPVLGLGLAGLCWLWRKDRTAALALGLAFAGQMWINAGVSDFYGGAAFGARKFINCSAIFALGLACLIQATQSRLRPRFWYALLGALIVWNMLFMLQYNLGAIPRGHPLSFQELVLDKFLLPLDLLRR